MFTLVISIPRASRYSNANDANLESIQYFFEDLFSDKFICAIKPYNGDSTKAKVFFNERVHFAESQPQFVINNTVNARVLERNDEEVAEAETWKTVQLPQECHADQLTGIQVDIEMTFKVALEVLEAQSSRVQRVQLRACHPEVLAAAERLLLKLVAKLPACTDLGAAADAGAGAAASTSAASTSASSTSAEGLYNMEVAVNSRCTAVLQPHDITHLRCDLIIVTTSCSLSLRYGLARQVAELAGASELRRACRRHLQQLGANLAFGDTFLCDVPASAATHFRQILFVALPNDKRSTTDADDFRRLMDDLAPRWFAAAAAADVDTAALPPIGATLRHWRRPLLDFADVLADGLRRQRNRTGRLRRLTFCDVSEPALASLGAALQRAFGPDACRLLALTTATATDDADADADAYGDGDLAARATGASGDCCLCASAFGADNPHTRFHCDRGQLCRSCVRRLEAPGSHGNGRCVHCHSRYRPAVGDQPPGGTVAVATANESLPGHEDSGTIVVQYRLPAGTQNSRHPAPGTAFRGTTRVAYFPDSDEGRRVVRRLQAAFRGGVIFTVGTSATTGEENCITWATVHHKTARTGGPAMHGYPDETYLQRVSDELADLGY